MDGRTEKQLEHSQASVRQITAQLSELKDSRRKGKQGRTDGWTDGWTKQLEQSRASVRQIMAQLAKLKDSRRKGKQDGLTDRQMDGRSSWNKAEPASDRSQRSWPNSRRTRKKGKQGRMDRRTDKETAGTKPSQHQTDHGAAGQTQEGLGGKVSCDGHTDGWMDRQRSSWNKAKPASDRSRRSSPNSRRTWRKSKQ